ncbi:MnhB domain-containing protein [Algoriphagus formosus]|uniref:MnhB domain-containing protein n=1 Tax=Algoriphagus formosus TaxID=2007308 RepID=UPI00140441F6|nr:MnhB domain-containing protein [Algoriphagus aquimaris]
MISRTKGFCARWAVAALPLPAGRREPGGGFAGGSIAATKPFGYFLAKKYQYKIRRKSILTGKSVNKPLVNSLLDFLYLYLNSIYLREKGEYLLF